MTTKNIKKSKSAIFLTIALDLIGLTIIFPLLPLFQEHYDVSYLMIGIMGAAYALCSFVSAPLLGRLSDRRGRKSILFLSILGSAVGWFVTAFAPNFWWVLVGRIIDGVTAGNITIAQAILSDISEDQKERAKYYGIFGMMFGLSMIVGPLLGSFLVQWGYAVPFIVSGVLSLINAALIWTRLPETHTPSTEVPKSSGMFPIFGVMFGQKISLYLWVALLVGLGTGVYRTSYSLYMDGFYGLTIQQIGFILASTGFFMAFCQGFLLGKFWLKKFTPRKILTITLIASVILFSVTASYDQFSASSVLVWLLFEVVTIFFTVAMWPVLQSEGVSHADDAIRGEVNGYFSSIWSLTAVVAPLVGAWVIQVHISPMWCASLFSLVAFALFWKNKKSF